MSEMYLEPADFITAMLNVDIPRYRLYLLLRYRNTILFCFVLFCFQSISLFVKNTQAFYVSIKLESY